MSSTPAAWRGDGGHFRRAASGRIPNPKATVASHEIWANSHLLQFWWPALFSPDRVPPARAGGPAQAVSFAGPSVVPEEREVAGVEAAEVGDCRFAEPGGGAGG
jgi:hypothetical protein